MPGGIFSGCRSVRTLLTRISHTPSSRDAARTRSGEARPGFSAGLYEIILSKGNPGRNEAGAGRSKSQQKGYEKCGLEAGKSFVLLSAGILHFFEDNGHVLDSLPDV